MTRTWLTVLASLLTCLLALLVWVPSTRAQDLVVLDVGPLETVVSTGTRQAAGLTTWPDGSLGVLWEGDGSYSFYAPLGNAISGAARLIRTQGTLENPLAYGVEVAPITGLKDAYDYYSGGQPYACPGTGLRLMFMHTEHWFQGNARHFVGAVALARSFDRGHHWEDVGEILTSFRGMELFDAGALDHVVHPNIGTGGAFLVREGYFYFYFNDRITIPPRDGLSVARAPVAEVCAAAYWGSTSPWVKYYNGSWTEPGLRGVSTELEAVPWHGIGVFSVAYHEPSGTHLLVGADWGVPTPVYLMESRDGVTWYTAQQLPIVERETVFLSLVGPGPDPQRLGATFFLYSASSPVIGRWVDTILARRFLSVAAPACSSGWCVSLW